MTVVFAWCDRCRQIVETDDSLICHGCNAEATKLPRYLQKVHLKERDERELNIDDAHRRMRDWAEGC